MGRKRNEYDKELLRAAVASSKSWADVHRRMGLSQSGSSYKGLQRTADELGLDLGHFQGQAWDRSERWREIANWGGRIPLDKLLVANSPFQVKNNKLKKRLIEEGLIEDVCVKCGQGNEWQGEPLVLQVDHINGESTDNRLENLRVLCPNCHTQTSTWGNKVRT